LKQQIGTNAYFFSSFNPTGHYRLDLNIEVQRNVAKNLLVTNKKMSAAVKAKECVDRSQVGNQSCFRNERVNNFKFEMTPNWRLPDQGIFEFDFVYLLERPTIEQETPQEEIVSLLEWFEATYEHLKQFIDPKNKDEGHAQIGRILGESFRGIAEYFVFSADQLTSLVDLINEENWKFEVFMAGIGRLWDQ
jgi:hypothetical protein